MTLIFSLALSAQNSPASRLFKGSGNAESPPFAGFIRAHKEKGSAQTVLPLCSLFCLVRAPGGLICPGGVARQPLIYGPLNILVHAFANAPGGCLYFGFLPFGQSKRHSVQVICVPCSITLLHAVRIFALWHSNTPPYCKSSIAQSQSLNKCNIIQLCAHLHLISCASFHLDYT